MKTFNIDLEKIDGAVLEASFLRFNGKMTVLEIANQLEGYENSEIHMSLPTAIKFAGFLNAAIADAKARGMR